MGNALGRKKKEKTAKVMTADGAVTRLTLPASAAAALRGRPRHSLFDAEEVGRAGTAARPLSPAQPLRPGKLYFLLELPRPSSPALRRVRSPDLRGETAADRLESLRLLRSPPPSPAEGGLQIRVRLPRDKVRKLLEEAEDGAGAAERIAALCLAEQVPPPSVVASPSPARREKRTRFMPIAEGIR